MTTRIYGDTLGRVLIQEGLDKYDLEIHLFKVHNGLYPPSLLVIANLTEAKAIRDYLTKIINEHKDYWKGQK